MSKVVVVLDNIRSLHNVGSILRTCDGFGVSSVICCGHTPYPKQENDQRLIHVQKRATDQIAKTALGVEKYIECIYKPSLIEALNELKKQGYLIWCIEQSKNSVLLNNITGTPDKLALVFGNEVEGINLDSIAYDEVIEIPMMGKKESFNVSVSVGIVLYKFNSL